MAYLYKIVFKPPYDAVDVDAITQALLHSDNAIEVTNDKDAADFIVSQDNLVQIYDRRIGVMVDRLEQQIFKINSPDEVTYNNYILSLRDSCLNIHGTPIPLSEREKDMIFALIKGGKNGVSREHLLLQIWGYKTDLETHALETQIYRLRQKIEDIPEKPQRLKTIENGYMLI